VPPYQATSSAKAASACRVVAFDCAALRQSFEEDTRFGYLMMQKAAQIIRDRLHDAHLEALGSAAG